jgi:hypothetical protein
LLYAFIRPQYAATGDARHAAGLPAGVGSLTSTGSVFMVEEKADRQLRGVLRKSAELIVLSA